MECRRLLSNTTIRIAAYNIEDDINGATTPLPGLYQVLEGIGEEKLTEGTGSAAVSNVQPIDILGLEETTSNSVTVAPIVTALNNYYGSTAVYAQSTFQGTESGGDTADGNGPNAVIYNTSTLTLLQSVGVGTAGGSSNGEYRQPIRYEFQPVADLGTSNGTFYVYVLHTKSGSGSTNATYRGEEATIVRNNEANLPPNASVIYMGDLNSNPPEAEFTEFGTPSAVNTGGTTVTQGSATDPAAYSSALQYITESATDLHYRDDYQLQTANVAGDTGNLNYLSGSFHVFGNNGTTPLYGTTNSSSNTSLNTDLTPDPAGSTLITASQLYGYLTTASDHLPVVADYSIPTTPVIGTFTASPNPVAPGANVTLSASGVTETGLPISSVSFYSETNGTSGLQVGSDTLLGTGTLSGSTYTLTTSTSATATGSATYYAVATDSNGNVSAASSASVSFVANPTIGSFVANPTTVPAGTAFNLVASSVTDPGTTVTSVAFYMESNGTSGLQTTGTYTDTYLGTGTATGTTYTLSGVSSTGLTAGTYSYYAVATSALSASTTASTTLAVTQGSPVIGTFTASPTSVSVGTNVTVSAIGVTDTGGTITDVRFYRGVGTQNTSLVYLGYGVQNGTTYSLSSSTAGLSAGMYTYYAIADDSTGATSAIPSAAVTTYALPAWLAAGSLAYFNPSTKGLTVTGAATIIADPGSDEPIITATAASAQLAIKPSTNDIDIHVGGVKLSGGAGIDVVSVGSARTHSDHNTLIVGVLNATTDPVFSASGSSKINLEDNDLIVHTGSNDSTGQTELSTVQALAATGRNVAPGGIYDGTWTGNGLTSSAAAAADSASGAGYEQNVLAVALNSDLFLGTETAWTVGSASETLNSNDIIVKYTYNGDLALDGAVDGNAATVFSTFYDGGASTQNDYVFGDLNGDGKVDGNDATIFSTVFGNGTAGSGLPLL